MGIFATVGFGVIGIIFAVLLLVIVFSVNYKTARPDEALIINGSLLGKKNTHPDASGNKLKILRGTGSLVLPIIQQSNSLSLLTSKLDVSTPEVFTGLGVPIMADGTAIIKVGSSLEDIATAAEQFLGKPREDLENEAREVLEGHLRSILGSMTVEQIYQDRDEFSRAVQDVASVDLAKMGLVIVSFTIKDIRDNNGYLDSLGKPRIAEVKRDAHIAEAIADKETRIKRAEAEKESQKSELERKSEIEEARKDTDIKVASYRQEADVAKARADQAYALEDAKLQQEIKEQTMQVEIIEREKQIELQEKETIRNEKQFDSEVRKKADAERYAEEQDAEAKKAREIAVAEAEAKKISLEGLARAESILAIGKAEAEAKEKLAIAYEKYGDAALVEMVLAILPEMAEKVAKPLSNIDKVTVLDGGSGDGVSGFAGNTGKVMAQTRELTSEMLGLDISELISSFVGNKNIGSKISDLTDTLKEVNEDSDSDTQE